LRKIHDLEAGPVMPRALHMGLVLGLVLAFALAAWPLASADARSSGAKRSRIDEIIIHATGGPSCRRGKVVFSNPGTLQWMARFFKRSRRVSIHYIVGRDGRIARGVAENRVAIHARHHNRTSIGIEMINEGNGRVAFPKAQVAALVKLVRAIRRRHAIALSKILRHSDVDHSTFRCAGKRVRRKQDPGPAFDWKAFKAALRAPDGLRKLAKRRHIHGAARLLAPPRLIRHAGVPR